MQPFTGQISVFGFNFPPANWMLCAGQTIAISSNTALFSLIGTTYGGNGTSTFQLPNLQGMVAVGQGQQPGQSVYSMGDVGGVPTVALSRLETPSHSHTLGAAGAVATQVSPAGNVLARPTVSGNPGSFVGKLYNTNTPDTPLNAPISTVGGGMLHDNLQPYLAINYCICVRGIFPQRG